MPASTTRRKPAAKAKPQRLTAEQVAQIAAVPAPEAEVFIPQWNATVLVRGLSFNAQIKVMEETDGNDFNDRLLAACVVDPPLSIAQAKAINDGPAAIGNLLIEAINECNGEGASEEALKTFPAGAPE